MFELEDGLELDGRIDAAPIASSSKQAAFELDDDLSLAPLEHARTNATLPLYGRTFDGSRISFKRRPPRSYATATKQDQEREERERNEATARLALDMLDEPMHRLLQNIEADRIKCRDEAEQRALAVEFEHDEPVKAAASKGKGKAKETMWTDLYKPHKFSELLGDDRVHRAAMAWLKEWDACVFKPLTGPEIAAARKKAAARKRALGPAPQVETIEPTDPYGRPQEKIMLLCGPPGLGKTTLAHVLALQAGYAVTEINASDDRTSKVVTDRIRESLETRAMSADGTIASNKPTCVIIDEIDGASGGDAGGFVRSLIKLVQDGSAPKKGRGKGKKAEHRPLLRPIICICNDLYAPVLRPLRTMARIVRFTAPTNAMLVKRLRDICQVEQIEVDSKNLGSLVELAEGDMRSCLNTLQFIKTKSGRVDAASLKSAAVGLKDSGTSPNAVWQTVFRIPHDRKGAKRAGDDGRFVNRIVKAVQTCGEYDRLQQGCFEHYLTVRSPSDTWAAINSALGWVHACDSFELRMNRHHDYDMMPYLPYMLAPWHQLFAHVANKKLEWPKADYEAYLNRQAHQEIADTLKKSLPMTLAASFTATSVVAELAPLLIRILSPDLRPVNSQLVRADEKASLAKLIHVMTTLGLSFVLDKNEDGQLSFKLEPPIDVFVHYEGKRSTDIAPSRFGVRSIVAKEMEAIALRKAGNEDATTSTAADLMAAYRATAAEPGREAPALDFFGRTVVKPIPELVLPANDENEPVRPAKRARLAFKFNEGFSNAVKLPIKVSGLFA